MISSGTQQKVRDNQQIKRDSIIVCLIAALIFFVESLVWSFSSGRDFPSYIWYYLQFFQPRAALPMIMIYRAPGASLFIGAIIDHFGVIFMHSIMGVFFVCTVFLVYRIGIYWNRRTGFIASLAVGLNPAYGRLFHTIASDSIFAFAFVIWVYFVLKGINDASPKYFFTNAFLIFLLVLIRPGSQILLLFGIAPFLLKDRSLKQKIRCSGAFFLTASFLIILWSSHNYLRYNDFTVARGGKWIVPLYRTFNDARIVKPQNGKHSKALARAVELELLSKEPYRSYEIDLDDFFSLGSNRMYGDLVGLSDKIWGWESDYSKLRKVAIEAIIKHPFKYFSNGLLSFWYVMTINHDSYVVKRAPTIDPIDSISSDTTKKSFVYAATSVL